MRVVLRTSLICLTLIFWSTVVSQSEAFTEGAAATLDMLKEGGGYNVYIRHTHTDRSQSDSALSSCDTQRNLSEQGQNEAREIGEVYKQLEPPVSRLISTEYCRTKETAELAFGEPEIILRSNLRASLETLLSAPPVTGTNVFIVAHIGMLERATGLDVGTDVLFNEGDSLIFRPSPKGTSYITLMDWPKLLEVQKMMEAAQ